MEWPKINPLLVMFFMYGYMLSKVGITWLTVLLLVICIYIAITNDSNILKIFVGTKNAKR